MDLHIRRADIRTEARSVADVDRRIFGPDAYSLERWRRSHNMICFWLVVDRSNAGMVVLEEHVDVDRKGEVVSAPGNLYVTSTGILKRFRGRGLGAVAKAYEVAYANRYGFKSISATCRAGNEPIIRRNGRFGFEPAYRIPGYYGDEDAMHLRCHLSPQERTKKK